MNLIDTYVSEVGRLLSGKNRADIEAEIRSTLQDMLDERSRQSGRAIDDELTLDVLREFGSPEKVAASYQGERFLIGPKFYPAYIKVIQIVLPIMGVLALVGLGFSLASSSSVSERLIGIISKAVNEFFGSMISALGIITIIFAILERSGPDFKTKKVAWDPRTLFEITPPDRIKFGEMVVEIFFSSLAILVFNFFPQIVGFTPSLNNALSGNGQAVTFIPILSEAFFRYVPFLTALWGLTILLDGILIQRGRWENWSRWSVVGLKALGIGIAAVMFIGPSIVVVDANSLISYGTQTVEVAKILIIVLNPAVRFGLIMSILFGGLDLVKMVIRILRGKSLS